MLRQGWRSTGRASPVIPLILKSYHSRQLCSASRLSLYVHGFSQRLSKRRPATEGLHSRSRCMGRHQTRLLFSGIEKEKAAHLTQRFFDSKMRTSPGMRSPADRLTMSPGTTSLISIDFIVLSRRTLVLAVIEVAMRLWSARLRSSSQKRSPTAADSRICARHFNVQQSCSCMPDAIYLPYNRQHSSTEHKNIKFTHLCWI